MLAGRHRALPSQRTLDKAHPYRYHLLIIAPFLLLLAAFLWLVGTPAFLFGRNAGLMIFWMLFCWLIALAAFMMLRLACVLVCSPESTQPPVNAPMLLPLGRLHQGGTQLPTGAHIVLIQPMPGQVASTPNMSRATLGCYYVPQTTRSSGPPAYQTRQNSLLQPGPSSPPNYDEALAMHKSAPA